MAELLLLLILMPLLLQPGKVLGWTPRFGRDKSYFLQPFFRQSNDVNGIINQAAKREKKIEKYTEWTTNDWLKQYNYTYETHNVTTADGYQLQMQRLPHEGARPILLVHGLFMSSLAWVLMGPQKSLAFQLYNSNYDVWLANLRGSAPYGRTHIELNTTSAEFWNYTFHEQGAYDVAALIDYILDHSSAHQVLLIAHSQAFNALLVLCSLRPIYNERILFMQALAPITRLKNYVKFNSQIIRRIMKFAKIQLKSGVHELFPPGSLKKKCLSGKSEKRAICSHYLKLIAGSGQHVKAVETLIFGQLIQGGSYKEIQHLQQIWQSGDFIAFDYGPIENCQQYNSVESLNYNLSEIKVPMVLHFGETDASATPEGVHSIYAKMHLNTVLGVHRIEAKKFNHFDFIFSMNIKTLVNNKLIEIMENFMMGKLKYVIE